MKYRFNCVKCGLIYATDYPKPGKCPRCWALSSGFDLGKMSRGLIEQVGLLERELRHARNQMGQSSRPGPVLDQEMLRRLIHLTHPDKHGGSQAAQIATTWLLEQREAMR